MDTYLLLLNYSEIKHKLGLVDYNGVELIVYFLLGQLDSSRGFVLRVDVMDKFFFHWISFLKCHYRNFCRDLEVGRSYGPGIW